MFDVVQLMLRLSYYYSLFLGVLNFEIDTRNGHARLTTQSTVYAAVVNVLMVCLLPLLTQSELLHLMWVHAGLIHEYLFLVVMGMRMGCVIATLFSRWLQRHRLLHLVNAVRRLAIERPQVVRMWRRGVIKKFLSVFASELVQMLGNILTLQTFLTFNLVISIFSLYMLTALLNVIISHYYFIMLNIRSHYMLLKQELRCILAETRCLEREPRQASFMIKCCTLADRLEAIAARQSELQRLVDLMSRIFGLQGCCISTTSYITCIGSIYFTFCAVKRTAGMSLNPFYYLLIAVELIVYFVDLQITVNNIYTVLDEHRELVQLLEEYPTFASGLDRRLEAVYESFQLQLRRKPLRISILGLFYMDKTRVISMANAIATNSIVLIQYEIKYSSN
ncbi:hypothetical protein KR093_008299 [Drosophila rubida]|uniref:Gustatory receptor n=1 Tax=Drosophila rubida TaxID=30044 RepID=A0AAD4JRC6_9MUSC|nr:hypothetical protein KR093_008299 [Drosophila rubida]